jgi:formiminoglutamase
MSLQNSEAKYVIIGIPEDIGIRANFGRPGPSAWETAIKILPTA